METIMRRLRRLADSRVAGDEQVVIMGQGRWREIQEALHQAADQIDAMRDALIEEHHERT